jgi:phytoene/squalene synthetase
MDSCYLGQPPADLCEEEGLLADLIESDPSKTCGLHTYIHKMMNVMAFDAARRGRRITQAELTSYTQSLATAVTEALHYFIGHRCFSPRGDLRYLAVNAAHITHMLRDTLEDAPDGYFNIPKEYLETHGLDVQDVDSEAYKAWVMSRVLLARQYFQAGKNYLMKVECFRCRVAGFAYVARFESILDAIQRDGYKLRREYPERHSLASGIKMAWSTLSWAFKRRRTRSFSHALPVR